MQARRPSPIPRPALGVALAACLWAAAGTCPAQTAPVVPALVEGETGLMLVSPVSNPGVFAPVQDAKQTVLAAAYVSKYGMRLYSKTEWSARGQKWEPLLAEAIQRADRLVDALEPQFKRDSRGVIDYAVVEHASPWLSSVLLSRRFLPRFEREFGKRLHVVVVDRHRFYVFPAEGGKLAGFGESLVEIYHDETVARYPVSLEVFQVDDTGFRAIGSIGD